MGLATIVLTDEQVIELVMQLSPESKRFILQALKAEDGEVSEPEIVDKDSVLVVRNGCSIDDILARWDYLPAQELPEDKEHTR